MRKTAMCLATLGLLTACGSSDERSTPADSTAETTAPAEATEVAAAEEGGQPAALAQCTVCHTYDKDGANGVGPNLWGVYGSPAAAKEGYIYSTALKDSGITWDDATLDAYITNPKDVVPGGKMSFAGMPDEAKRQEVIAYLATLTDSAE